MEEHPDEAYVTLATNDVYAVGAMVLAYSLRATCTTRQLVVMVTPEVSNAMRELLPLFFDVIFDVTPIDSNDFDNLSLLNRQVVTNDKHCTRYDIIQNRISEVPFDPRLLGARSGTTRIYNGLYL